MAYWMQPVLEIRDDSEIRSRTPQAAEKIVASCITMNSVTVISDHVS
jgi:hypothetical protein